MSKREGTLSLATVAALGLSLIAAPVFVDAATLVTWNFNGNGNVASQDAQVNATAWTAHDTTDESSQAEIGFSSTSPGYAYVRSEVTGSTQANALADDDYFSWTVSTVDPAKQLDLTGLQLTAFAAGVNAASLETTIYVLVNGTLYDSVTWSNFATAQTKTLDLSGVANLQSATFQLRFSDSFNDSTYTRIDTANLLGTVVEVVAVPEPASMALSGLLALAGLCRRRV